MNTLVWWLVSPWGEGLMLAGALELRRWWRARRRRREIEAVRESWRARGILQ